jgi:hypothetical protein
MKATTVSEGFAWLCDVNPDEVFYHWCGKWGGLWWSERSEVLFPGYWGA